MGIPRKHYFFIPLSQNREIKGNYLDMKRMCLKKIPYVSYDYALEAALSYNNDPEVWHEGKKMCPYECPYCEFFHTGRMRYPHMDRYKSIEELFSLGFERRVVNALTAENHPSSKNAFKQRRSKLSWINGQFFKANYPGRKIGKRKKRANFRQVAKIQG
jgi:hypothetical protein